MPYLGHTLAHGDIASLHIAQGRGREFAIAFRVARPSESNMGTLSPGLYLLGTMRDEQVFLTALPAL